jgi:hypothetical protein
MYLRGCGCLQHAIENQLIIDFEVLTAKISLSLPFFMSFPSLSALASLALPSLASQRRPSRPQPGLEVGDFPTFAISGGGPGRPVEPWPGVTKPWMTRQVADVCARRRPAFARHKLDLSPLNLDHFKAADELARIICRAAQRRQKRQQEYSAQDHSRTAPGSRAAWK